MPKPDWLVEAEGRVNWVKCATCWDCIYLGMPVKMTKHRNKSWTEVFECDIHPGCFNTKYSICCDDFTIRELV